MQNQQGQQAGISLDFRPEVEMVLELHNKFPGINGANRPVALDRTINQMFHLIEQKALLQNHMLRQSIEAEEKERAAEAQKGKDAP